MIAHMSETEAADPRGVVGEFSRARADGRGASGIHHMELRWRAWVVKVPLAFGHLRAITASGSERLARASPRSTQLASSAFGSVQLRSLAGASRGLIAVFIARAGLSP